jgi:hypothetical protein
LRKGERASWDKGSEIERERWRDEGGGDSDSLRVSERLGYHHSERKTDPVPIRHQSAEMGADSDGPEARPIIPPQSHGEID